MSFEGTPSEELNLAINRPETYVFTAFASITLCLSIDLITLTLATFKRYSGVYFYSLLITSCALIVNTIGYLLFFFTHISPYAAVAVILVGWYSMVTGHSVRIQLIVFCLQELLLSGIYIYETGRLLQLRPRRTHKIILIQLLAINIIILFLDIAVVVLQYSGLYALQVMFKPVAYAVKVRLEYAILGRLVQIATNGSLSAPIEAVETPSWPIFIANTHPSSTYPVTVKY
ncbi:hypothetical protein BJX64DRAFT_275787 [Aspergillus heterothallicus]